MELLLILAASAVALVCLAVAVGMLVLSNSAFNARLVSHGKLAARAPGVARSLRPRVDATLQRLGRLAGRGALDTSERAGLRLRLVRGGYYGERAPEAFYAVRVVTALGFGVAAILGVVLFRIHTSILAMLLIMVSVAIGLYLPNLLLQYRIGKRATAMRHGLPDAVDLMVVCLEAGGTLSSAIQRVEAEFRDLHPLVCEQFQIAILEMQAGSSRAEALQRMAERVGVEEVQSLVGMLVQSEALGASVAQTMRVFADQSRESRQLDAERRAAELPVKMTFPLVLFIFPALMLVIFTPLIVRIFHVLLRVNS